MSADIAERLAALAGKVEADAALLRRGRYLNTTCQLDIAKAEIHFSAKSQSGQMDPELRRDHKLPC